MGHSRNSCNFGNLKFVWLTNYPKALSYTLNISAFCSTLLWFLSAIVQIAWKHSTFGTGVSRWVFQFWMLRGSLRLRSVLMSTSLILQNKLPHNESQHEKCPICVSQHSEVIASWVHSYPTPPPGGLSGPKTRPQRCGLACVAQMTKAVFGCFKIDTCRPVVT